MAGKGPAWMRMRREVAVLSALFIALGSALALMGAWSGPPAAILAGAVVAGIGIVILLIRPWTYLQRLEAQAAACKEGLSVPRARRVFGPADVRWHHEGEDGHRPGVCERCGMTLDAEGRCRICQEEEG